MRNLLDWFIDTYLSDRWVPRADYDASRLAYANRIRMLEQAKDSLQYRYNDLLCRGLERCAFLPKFMSDRGTVDCEVRTDYIREKFQTRVQLFVSDQVARALEEPVRAAAIDYMARQLAVYVRADLMKKFEPPFPGRK